MAQIEEKLSYSKLTVRDKKRIRKSVAVEKKPVLLGEIMAAVGFCRRSGMLHLGNPRRVRGVAAKQIPDIQVNTTDRAGSKGLSRARAILRPSVGAFLVE